MNKIVLVIAFIIFCLCGETFGQPDSRLQISQRGLFTIVVPGSDSTKIPIDDSSARGTIFNVKIGQIAYQVSYKCLCIEPRNLNLVKEQLLPKNQTTWKLVSESSLKLDAIGGAKPAHLTGKEFVIENNDMREIHRFYASDSNLYELIVISPKTGPGPPEATEFFSSFKVFGTIIQLVKTSGIERNSLNKENWFLIDHDELLKFGKFNRPLGYPVKARENRIRGSVIIDAVFDKTGKVVSAELLCGDSILAEEAMKTARAATITPIQVGGKPVRVESLMVFHFTI